MALLTENRNKIPLVESLPVSNITPGKRGDMVMTIATGSPLGNNVYACTQSSTSKTDGTNSVWIAKPITEAAPF